MRGGEIRFVEWGAHHTDDSLYVDPVDGPGQLLRLPRGYWVPLEEVRGNPNWWSGREARPVKIAASHFLVSVPLQDIPFDRLIALKPGEFLQGALAKVYSERRVYLVSVPPPNRYRRYSSASIPSISFAA